MAIFEVRADYSDTCDNTISYHYGYYLANSIAQVEDVFKDTHMFCKWRVLPYTVKISDLPKVTPVFPREKDIARGKIHG